MKKLLGLASIFCANLYAVPAWQFTLSEPYDGEFVHHTSEPILFNPNRTVSTKYLPHVYLPNCGITVTCCELGNDIVEYTVEIPKVDDSPRGGIAIGVQYKKEPIKATVTARVGEDASITVNAGQGQFTITFSSRI